jgi:Mrp family chromosome partitioning ATPase
MSEISNIPEGVSTLRHYVLTLWRRRWLVLAPLLALPLLVYVLSVRQSEVHEAWAEVLVNQQEVAATSLIGQTPAVVDAERTMDTNSSLARVPQIVDPVAKAHGLPPNVLRANSTAYGVADLLRFVVTDADASRAASLATAYAERFVSYRRELDTAGLARILRDLGAQLADLEQTGQSDSPLYDRLADREQQLESLLALRLSNVSVVRSARVEDTEQVAPRPLRNTALAVVAGLVLGLVLAFLAENLSTKPRSPEEIEALLDMPLLAQLTKHQLPLAPDAPVADAFHRLRTSLKLENRRVGARTILVTDVEDEHRSSALARLGLALAHAGRDVALVDLDLRAGALSRLFGLEDKHGITSLTTGANRLDDALVTLALGDRAPSADGSLALLGSGSLPDAPVETLASPVVAEVLAELAQRFDLVLVDAPSLLSAPDAAALSDLVDGVVVLIGGPNVRRPDLAAARRAVEQWPAARLGFVLDGRNKGDAPVEWPVDRAARTPLVPVTTSEQAS